MILRSERLLLRPFETTDAADVYAFAGQADFRLTGYAPMESLFDARDLTERWIRQGPDEKHAIVWSATGRVIGYVAVNPDSEEGRADTRELGCALLETYRRRGVMTEALDTVLAALFARPEIKYVWACCFQKNEPSRGLIEKLGFSFVQEGSYYAELLHTEFPSYEYRMDRTGYKVKTEDA